MTQSQMPIMDSDAVTSIVVAVRVVAEEKAGAVISTVTVCMADAVLALFAASCYRI